VDLVELGRTMAATNQVKLCYSLFLKALNNLLRVKCLVATGAQDGAAPTLNAFELAGSDTLPMLWEVLAKASEAPFNTINLRDSVILL
jgi:hypothetical protein